MATCSIREEGLCGGVDAPSRGIHPKGLPNSGGEGAEDGCNAEENEGQSRTIADEHSLASMRIYNYMYM